MKLPAGYVAGQGVVKPTGYGGFGERMLRDMGWHAGDGLGKARQGMKQAIEVKKKEDTAGIGGVLSYDWQNKWWESAFDSAAKSINTGGSDSSDSEDSEDEAPTGAARNRDGTLTSASADELKLQAALSQGGRLAAGRFGGRDGKLARIRAHEAKAAADAAAKLAPPQASDRSDTTSDARLPSGSETAQQPASTSEKRSKKRQKREDGSPAPCTEVPVAAATRQRIVIEPVVAAMTEGQHKFKPTQMLGWWGAKMFASAGCLQGMEKDVQAQRQREAFDEDKQASIWGAAHEGRTQGKVGLGQGTRTVQVGGVKWSGVKVTFEQPADGEAEGSARKQVTWEEPAAEEAGEDADTVEEREERRREKKARKKEQKARLQAMGSSMQLAELTHVASPAAAAVEEAPPAWAESLKWRKLVSRALRAAPGGQLKMKALLTQVTAAVQAKVGGEVSRGEVKAALAAALQASSQFVVDCKMVRLRA